MVLKGMSRSRVSVLCRLSLNLNPKESSQRVRAAMESVGGGSRVNPDNRRIRRRSSDLAISGDVRPGRRRTHRIRRSRGFFRCLQQHVKGQLRALPKGFPEGHGRFGGGEGAAGGDPDPALVGNPVDSLLLARLAAASPLVMLPSHLDALNGLVVFGLFVV